MATYNPPLSRATKISSSSASYHACGDNIAAIDFGTTSVSLAYTTKGDDEVNTLVLDSDRRSMRVPNAILLKRDESKNISVVGFGSDTRTQFASMKAEILSEHIYFERVKMHMRKEKKVTRQTQVKASSGEKFYLVEVIAFILQHLKNQLIEHFIRSPIPLKTTDFDWVITVPAIWDACGKRMMREAAYMAGLLTESGGINQFTPISDIPLLIPDETNSNRLLLALEPESAAFFCQETIAKQKQHSDIAIELPTEYMVIDIGGGTVDITAHMTVNGEVTVLNIPTGNESGGTKVNKAFSKLMEKLLNDQGFKKFCSSRDHSQQIANLNKIFYSEFENQKIAFGQGNLEDIAIGLPRRFSSFFEEFLKSEVDKVDGIEYDEDTNDTLYVDKKVVEKELFGPAIDGIIDCTLAAIKENEFKVSTFYLVGGFGGCRYVHQKLMAAINKLYTSEGRTCNVLVPPTPQLAVATGAVMWRRNPGKIKARRSDATYGIATTLPFDPEKHDEHYKFFDKDRNEYRCNNVLDVFLEKGELIDVNQNLTIDLSPSSASDTTVSIEIYSTPCLGVQYIKDRDGKKMAVKIGKLVIDAPNPDNLPVEERIIDVTMDFSGTEIQAKAKYRINGKEVKTVCDFLSTY